MHTDSTSRANHSRRHRPSRVTVFATAFIAGAAVAFGVNRMLDVHLAQTRPQVECEPIFVALHSLPQGAPITVWDVALKDWPRAMLPTSALRARDTFEGMVLRHPLREGQPLLSVQLVPADGAARSAAVPAEQSFTNPLPAAPATQAAASPEADLWAPAVPAKPEVAATSTPRASRTDVDAAPTVTPHPIPVADTADTFVAPQPASVPTAAAPADTVRVDPPAAATEPTLAAVPEPATDPQPESAQPELLASTAPLYAPVPASPPTDLDGQLAGVGGLPATGAPQDPNAAASVLKQTADGGPAAGPQPPQSAGRYLVVPERIAMQADTAFAPPPAAQAPAAAQRPQQSPAAKTATKPVNRPGTANGQRSGTKRPQQQSQQAGQGADRQATAAPSRPLGGMFPNLTAGFEALSGSQRKPATAGQPSSTTR